MNKLELVTHLIQHDEDFPNIAPLDLDTARSIIGNIDPAAGLPHMTAEELMETWNTLIQDSSVMEE